MFVPVVDTTRKVVDEKGHLTPAWSFLFTQLFNQMQTNISDNGMVVPSLTPDQISQYSNPTNTKTLPNGTLYYDSVNHLAKVKINNVVKTITTS